MSAPTITLIDALTDEALFQPWFRGDSWNGWRAVVKAMDALPMSDDEIEFFKSIAGGRNPPRYPVREFYAAAARRSGKYSIVSGIGAYSSAFFDQQHRLRPGERATILCLACDQSQAKIVLNYIRSYFSDIPMLRSMVIRETKSGFELNNLVDITVASNDYRSMRGRPVRLAILDELAFFRSENSASPDVETYNAIRPALASLPGSRIIGISSPYRKSGLLWNKYRKHFGRDDDDVLVIQAATARSTRR
jgi:phage terminase large subunit-like protein